MVGGLRNSQFAVRTSADVPRRGYATAIALGQVDYKVRKVSFEYFLMSVNIVIHFYFHHSSHIAAPRLFVGFS